MPGTAGNIDAKIANEADRKGYGQVTAASEVPLPVAAGYLVRQMATGRALPKSAEHAADLWRGFVEEQAGETLSNLDHVLADQAAFARLARKVIADLGYGDQLGDDPDAPEDAGDDQAEEDQDSPTAPARSRRSEDTEASPERSQEEQQDQSQAQVTMEDSADMEQGDEAELPEGEAPLEPPPPPRIPMPTRTMRSIPRISMRKSRPKIWPSPPSWNACGPIWTSSWSR
jgi:cobaltochelatase CobT